ncbi:hypothetical protein P7K49_006018 [Saguinus oedipus]|uniref:Prolactin receptor n=1 Tax=Saguinus oedipus TaxID=9490 RepID=A0ABQ9W167_SAGOE|nr:hypothetical protein P7K49_006018 [Saguinus oedipus]
MHDGHSLPESPTEASAPHPQMRIRNALNVSTNSDSPCTTKEQTQALGGSHLRGETEAGRERTLPHTSEKVASQLNVCKEQLPWFPENGLQSKAPTENGTIQRERLGHEVKELH